jgi:NAD(P)-dependent dehydrogenase (short-subunit alcohol dehydrogenase family)
MAMESRTVVITGGTLGIGAAIVQAFHASGERVVVAARHDNGLARTLGERAIFQRVDVCDPIALHELAMAAVDWSGRLDVFVNNAGRSDWRPLELIDEPFWNEMLEVNLKSVLFGCQAAAKVMTGEGVILNISSMAGKRGTASNSVYCASKFGVNGITQALAKELGTRGVRVNAICPVLVRTEGLDAALETDFSPARGDIEEFLESFTLSNSALGRLPTASEVADFCVYLASARASAITGQCINVDCGVFPQ